MRVARVVRHLSGGALVAASVLCLVPRAAQSQSCAAGSLNSCLSVTFTPVRPTPTPSDFEAGVGVIGALNITVLKCGRAPCEVTAGAVNQPPSGLRLKIGGAAPVSIAECGVDITGVNSAPSAPAPTIALVSGPVSLTVWICQPLTWDPVLTPVGSWSPEFRFRLRQG